MNSKTRLMFNLAYIHNYINDILDMCNELDNNYPVIFTDKKSQYPNNMCFVQIGEHCAQIRDNNKSFYDNNELKLYQIKGMRDRIVHSYGKIDYEKGEKTVEMLLVKLAKMEVSIKNSLKELCDFS